MDTALRALLSSDFTLFRPSLIIQASLRLGGRVQSARGCVKGKLLHPAHVQGRDGHGLRALGSLFHADVESFRRPCFPYLTRTAGYPVPKARQVPVILAESFCYPCSLIRGELPSKRGRMSSPGKTAPAVRGEADWVRQQGPPWSLQALSRNRPHNPPEPLLLEHGGPAVS